MTNPTQAAHDAAMKAARDAFREDGAYIAYDLSSACRAYHAEMMKHERPAIEAEARDAALRAAALIIIRESKGKRVNDFDADEALAHAANSILALIPDASRNDGGK